MSRTNWRAQPILILRRNGKNTTVCPNELPALCDSGSVTDTELITVARTGLYELPAREVIALLPFKGEPDWHSASAKHREATYSTHQTGKENISNSTTEFLVQVPTEPYASGKNAWQVRHLFWTDIGFKVGPASAAEIKLGIEEGSLNGNAHVSLFKSGSIRLIASDVLDQYGSQTEPNWKTLAAITYFDTGPNDVIDSAIGSLDQEDFPFPSSERNKILDERFTSSYGQAQHQLKSRTLSSSESNTNAVFSEPRSLDVNLALELPLPRRAVVLNSATTVLLRNKDAARNTSAAAGRVKTLTSSDSAALGTSRSKQSIHLIRTLELTASCETVVFDLETTGLRRNRDRVIEIGAAIVSKGCIGERFSVLINHSSLLTQEITSLTGITRQMLTNGEAPDQAFARFVEFVGDRTLVAHNASFDVSFLHAETSRSSLNCLSKENICTMGLARALVPKLPKYKLDFLLSYFGLPLPRRHHRALDDAIATARLWIHLSDTARSCA